MDYTYSVGMAFSQSHWPPGSVSESGTAVKIQNSVNKLTVLQKIRIGFGSVTPEVLNNALSDTKVSQINTH